jgi:hypothetical protein
MTRVDERALGLFQAADLLEQWANALPKRGSDGKEVWYEFLDRRYEAEVALIERLRQAPGCRLETCSLRREIRLTLAGITVHTDQGLASALREWARVARVRAARY